MATTKKAGDAGQAAALLPIGAADALVVAISDASDSVLYRVLPILRAAQNLANCRRVLNDFEQQDCITRSFGDSLQEACISWRDPMQQDGYDLVSDLLRVAADMLEPVGERLEGEEVRARQLASALRTCATTKQKD